MTRRVRPIADRFWAKVNKHGGLPPAAPHLGECWLWTAATNNRGYGHMSRGRVGEGHLKAHRFSYELHHGPIPPRMHIDHRCHVTLCVNPSHLRVTTTKQNCENLLGASRNSRTGIRGVTWNVKTRRWHGSVCHHRYTHAAEFDGLDDAKAWVVAKRLELFTHSDMDRRAS